ncbi:MAG: toll/interleukin-1 receptor domain-containing protein [Ignavibacteriae bacterium]|nr:toll/interleukin-1 receptor domain-containing protein [Ignavibacteriota bacterium]
MSYTTFISYDTSPTEQVVVYRLQTLASVNGINVLLPQRNGVRITDETKHRIDISDSVLVFLTSKFTPQVREELAYAEGKGKLVIPIYEKGVKLSSVKNRDQWVEFNPNELQLGIIEDHIVQLLKTKKKKKANEQALLLAGLGIVLFAMLASKK